jgi:hypothetical protein
MNRRIRGAWMAACLAVAIMIGLPHEAWWKYVVTGLLVGAATWSLR